MAQEVFKEAVYGAEQQMPIEEVAESLKKVHLFQFLDARLIISIEPQPSSCQYAGAS